MEELKDLSGNQKPDFQPVLERKLTISVAETARVLGLSRPSVYTLVNRADFPAFRVGNRTLVSVDGLRRWVNEQAGGAHDN